MRWREEEGAALPVVSLVYPQSPCALKIWMKCHHFEGGKLDVVAFNGTTVAVFGKKSKHFKCELCPTVNVIRMKRKY